VLLFEKSHEFDIGSKDWFWCWSGLSWDRQATIMLVPAQQFFCPAFGYSLLFGNLPNREFTLLQFPNNPANFAFIKLPHVQVDFAKELNSG
jgi:hypothetical protein